MIFSQEKVYVEMNPNAIWIGQSICRDSEPSNVFHEISLHSPKTSLWYDFTASFIPGSYFLGLITNCPCNSFELIKISAQHISQPFVFSQLRQLKRFSEKLFMQDGAPNYIKRDVQLFLRQHLSYDRVTSWYFHMASLSRSFDLSQCKFWLQGY